MSSVDGGAAGDGHERSGGLLGLGWLSTVAVVAVVSVVAVLLARGIGGTSVLGIVSMGII